MLSLSQIQRLILCKIDENKGVHLVVNIVNRTVRRQNVSYPSARVLGWTAGLHSAHVVRFIE